MSPNQIIPMETNRYILIADTLAVSAAVSGAFAQSGFSPSPSDAVMSLAAPDEPFFIEVRQASRRAESFVDDWGKNGATGVGLIEVYEY